MADNSNRWQRIADNPEAKPIFTARQTTDAFRRPERFAQFLICCEAYARGRTGFEQRDYPQANYFRQALAACQGINAGDVSARGFTGKEFGDEINRLRLQILTAHRETAVHDQSSTHNQSSSHNQSSPHK